MNITPTEHDEQVRLFQWATLMCHHDVRFSLMFAIPNGGQRNKIVAAKLKKEGVKAGVPDICLPVPDRSGPYTHHALYIELKRQKGGMVTEKQALYHEALREQGNMVVVCAGWLGAARILCDYLAVPKTYWPSA